jgi:hypothetical protein
MHGWASRHPLAAAGAASAALWTAFFAFMGPRYATNDDPLMAMLAAGVGFARAPDEHLVFTNALVGLALKALHRARAGVPWHALTLLAAHVAAQTAILYASVARTSGRRSTATPRRARTCPTRGSSASAWASASRWLSR